MVEICVPSGKFYNDNAQVFLDSFWIDKFEVSNSQYMQCVNDKGACNQPFNKGSKTRGSYFGNPAFEDYPVIYISWQDAKSYCKWAKRRMPMDDEWKKAARGLDGRIYPWGNSSPNSNLLNSKSSNIGDTKPVDSYPDGKSYYGLINMSGNVMEWTSSRYQDKGNNNFIIIKGGAWTQNNDYAKIDSIYADTDKGDGDLGIRCLVDAF